MAHDHPGSTVPAEFDRILSEEERAVIAVRKAAVAAQTAGASEDRILAEARYGYALGLRLTWGRR